MSSVATVHNDYFNSDHWEVWFMIFFHYKANVDISYFHICIDDFGVTSFKFSTKQHFNEDWKLLLSAQILR